jgi:hypothetical protein
MRVNTEVDVRAFTMPRGARAETMAAPPDDAQAAAAGISSPAKAMSHDARQRLGHGARRRRHGRRDSRASLILLGWDLPKPCKQ